MQLDHYPCEWRANRHRDTVELRKPSRARGLLFKVGSSHMDNYIAEFHSEYPRDLRIWLSDPSHPKLHSPCLFHNPHRSKNCKLATFSPTMEGSAPSREAYLDQQWLLEPLEIPHLRYYLHNDSGSTHGYPVTLRNVHTQQYLALTVNSSNAAGKPECAVVATDTCSAEPAPACAVWELVRGDCPDGSGQFQRTYLLRSLLPVVCLPSVGSPMAVFLAKASLDDIFVSCPKVYQCSPSSGNLKETGNRMAWEEFELIDVTRPPLGVCEYYEDDYEHSFHNIYTEEREVRVRSKSHGQVLCHKGLFDATAKMPWGTPFGASAPRRHSIPSVQVSAFCSTQAESAAILSAPHSAVHSIWSLQRMESGCVTLSPVIWDTDMIDLGALKWIKRVGPPMFQLVPDSLCLQRVAVTGSLVSELAITRSLPRSSHGWGTAGDDSEVSRLWRVTVAPIAQTSNALLSPANRPLGTRGEWIPQNLSGAAHGGLGVAQASHPLPVGAYFETILGDGPWESSKGSVAIGLAAAHHHNDAMTFWADHNPGSDRQPGRFKFSLGLHSDDGNVWICDDSSPVRLATCQPVKHAKARLGCGLLHLQQASQLETASMIATAYFTINRQFVGTFTFAYRTDRRWPWNGPYATVGVRNPAAGIELPVELHFCATPSTPMVARLELPLQELLPSPDPMIFTGACTVTANPCKLAKEPGHLISRSECTKATTDGITASGCLFDLRAMFPIERELHRNFPEVRM
ncbi:hypothetical protein CYMTET_54760 [Cymbomonas tetramitiformis]|uniref:Uncharacterized protein n=1 Tax=Cymbomonas tetramitiformis TaxID=36881 RepID=A0AAE0BFG7_9CHLO|nr:hypothetical protein CYMTET_54760 [Cymbomonas tetramitiformis]